MQQVTRGKTDQRFLLVILIVAVAVLGGILSYQHLWLSKNKTGSSEVEKPKEEVKNCNSYEMPMTEKEIEECICPEGYIKSNRLRGAYCTTNSQKPCKVNADCPTDEDCVSHDKKIWFCTGQGFGCLFRDPKNPKELCVD